MAAQFWLNLQLAWDLYEARQSPPLARSGRFAVIQESLPKRNQLVVAAWPRYVPRRHLISPSALDGRQD